MTWQEELTLMVRVLVNDLDEPYAFSDDRIQQILAVSGRYVQFDVNLDNKYTIDVVSQSISPDPFVINDDIFISLICLKAACIIDQSTLRTKAALEGIRTSLGSANLSIGGSLEGWKEIIDKGACSMYDELTSHWDVQNATAVRAVLSPFVGNRFDPRYLLRGSFRSTNSNDFYS